MPKNPKSLIEEAGQGHNSLAPEELSKIVVAIESCLEQRKSINEDIKAAMDVAHQKGFDKRTIREVIKLRSLDAEKRKEREDLRDLYLSALGLV